MPFGHARVLAFIMSTVIQYITLPSWQMLSGHAKVLEFIMSTVISYFTLKPNVMLFVESQGRPPEGIVRFLLGEKLLEDWKLGALPTEQALFAVYGLVVTKIEPIAIKNFRTVLKYVN